MKIRGILAVFALFGGLLALAFGLMSQTDGPSAEATVAPQNSKAVEFAAKGPRLFKARKTTTGLEISGDIASEDDRQVLARFAPGDQISELSLVKGGGVLDWLGGQLVVLESLDQAISGDVDILRTNIVLSVYVDTDAERAAIEKIVKRVPPGFDISTAVLVRRPTVYPFKIKLEKILGGDLVLSGFSETDDDRFALMVEAAKVAGEAALSVDLKTGLGMPQEFLDTAKAAFPLIGKLQQGELALEGKQITLSGVLAPGATLADIKAGLRPLPGDWKLNLQD